MGVEIKIREMRRLKAGVGNEGNTVWVIQYGWIRE